MGMQLHLNSELACSGAYFHVCNELGKNCKYHTQSGVGYSTAYVY